MNQQSEWWKTAFGIDYDNAFGHIFPEDTSKEVEFLLKQLKLQTGNRVLDAACGNGRHSSNLAKHGLDVLGVDVSSSYIEFAKQSVQSLETRPNFLKVNLLNYKFDEKFDAVLLLGNAFGYFSHKENISFIQNLANALKSDGHFVIDVSNSNLIIPKLKVSDDRENCFEKKDGSIWTIRETYKFDSNTKVKKSHWQVSKNGNLIYELNSKIQFYSPDEISKILLSIGLKITKTFGSFSGDDFIHTSSRIIIFCKK